MDMLIFKLDCSPPLESTSTAAHLSGQLHTRIAATSMLGGYLPCLLKTNRYMEDDPVILLCDDTKQ